MYKGVKDIFSTLKVALGYLFTSLAKEALSQVQRILTRMAETSAVFGLFPSLTARTLS